MITSTTCDSNSVIMSDADHPTFPPSGFGLTRLQRGPIVSYHSGPWTSQPMYGIWISLDSTGLFLAMLVTWLTSVAWGTLADLLDFSNVANFGGILSCYSLATKDDFSDGTNGDVDWPSDGKSKFGGSNRCWRFFLFPYYPTLGHANVVGPQFCS